VCQAAIDFGGWPCLTRIANRRPEAGRASKREKQNQPRQCRAAGDGCCVGDEGRWGGDVGRCTERLRKLGPVVSVVSLVLHVGRGGTGDRRADGRPTLTFNHDLQQDRRIIGRRGVRHGSIIYPPHSLTAQRGSFGSHPPYARRGSAGPARRSGGMWITTPPPPPPPPPPTLQASALVHQPRSCGHHPPRVWPHLVTCEATVSQLPGLAALVEGARCDSLATHRRAQQQNVMESAGEQGTLDSRP